MDRYVLNGQIVSTSLGTSVVLFACVRGPFEQTGGRTGGPKSGGEGRETWGCDKVCDVGGVCMDWGEPLRIDQKAFAQQSLDWVPYP